MGYGYCILALASWTGLAFVYRLGERSRASGFYFSAAMGLSALALDLAAAVAWKVNIGQAHPSQYLIGAAFGVCATINIPSFLAALRRGDLSVTWTVLTLAFAPAAGLGILIHGERPGAGGYAGLVLAAAAVVLLGLDMARRGRAAGAAQPARGARSTSGWGLFMTLSFVTNVACLYAFTLADQTAGEQAGQMSLPFLPFLVTAHAAFGLGSLAAGLVRPTPGPVRAALGVGALAGTTSFLGALFTSLAIFSSKVPSHIVFPTTNGGSNLLVVALSVVLLKERPNRYGWLGIAAGIVALVLFGVAQHP